MTLVEALDALQLCLVDAPPGLPWRTATLCGAGEGEVRSVSVLDFSSATGANLEALVQWCAEAR